MSSKSSEIAFVSATTIALCSFVTGLIAYFKLLEKLNNKKGWGR